MRIKAIRIHFYKHEVKLLNLIALIILIIDGVEYFNQSLDFFKLLWSGVCIAATIFIDSCQQNVFRELAKKKVATIIIAIVILIGLATAVSLFI